VTEIERDAHLLATLGMGVPGRGGEQDEHEGEDASHHPAFRLAPFLAYPKT
jgi:hypothetical protein